LLTLSPSHITQNLIGIETTLSRVLSTSSSPTSTNSSYLGLITSLTCPSRSDIIYLGGVFTTVTDSYSEKVVNNIVGYNVVTKMFIPLQSDVRMSNDTHIGLSSTCPSKANANASPKLTSKANSECVEAEQVAMVRSLACSPSHDNGDDNECGYLFIGGYFNIAFGAPAQGLIRLTLPAMTSSDTVITNPTMTVIGDDANGDNKGINGLVMAITATDSDTILFGGIYEDTGSSSSPSSPSSPSSSSSSSSSDMPYLLNKWTSDTGVSCVINKNMVNEDICGVAHPPFLCCVTIFGPVYASLQISANDYIVGGEFVNALDINPSGGSDINNWFQLGYQNIAVVTLSATDGSDFNDDSLIGGPDGDVRALACGAVTVYDNDDWRCTVIYVGGSFNNWMNYTLDGETFDISKNVRFAALEHVAMLVWNDDTKGYVASSVFNEGSDEDHEPIIVMKEGLDLSVNSIMINGVGDTREMVFGGEFPSQNNIARFSIGDDHRVVAKLNIPNENYSPAKIDSEFYDCQIDNDATTLSGANFCCRHGSYCPGGLLDISCPDGWGFLCTNNNIGICPAGSYCETAGDIKPCPYGYVCKLGSVTPRKCEFWELCADNGLERPNRVSGLFLGMMVLGSMFTLLIVLVKVFSWQRKLGNIKMDKQFNYRYNAFKRNLNNGLSTRGRKSSAFEGIVNHPKNIHVNASNGAGANSFDVSMDDVTSERESPTQHLTNKPRTDSFVTNPTHMSNSSSSNNNNYTNDSSIHESGLSIEGGDAMSVDTATSRNKRELKIDISFKGLGVELVDGKKILQGVTGTLKAGRMTAIMGPSGCGKSTFLSALTNRIKDGGKVIGKVKINGENRPLLSIQHLVGFVPQEDIMHRDLSVRENLRFYAHLKGNPTMTRPQRRAFVNEIIDILGLSHVQHSLIGDEETRGISGGQRKRVNIGIELMASPLVLFLDEPTSGLDSTTTQVLIDSLEKLAKLGLTVAMVIHQPRYEVLLKIDDLLLLQVGGFPVYAGPTMEALPYFQNFLHSPCPDRTTPADHFLDVISANPTLEHGTVVDSWRWYVLNVIGEEAIEVNMEEYQDRVIPARSRPSRLYQTYAFAKRSFYQTMNGKIAFFTDCCLLVFAGGMVGAVSLVEVQGYQLTMMVTGLIAVVSSLKVFGPERVVFARETSAGISTLAYFMGKAFAHVWQIALAPLFYLGMFYRTAYPSVEFWAMYKIILANQFSCSGLGYLISVTAAPKNMQIAGVISGLIAVLLSGINPSARVLNSFIVGRFGLWCSYGPWTMGSLLVKQALNSPKAMYPSLCGYLDELGYLDINNSTLTSDETIEDSYVILEEKYVDNLQFMVQQYVIFGVIAYLVMSMSSKKASGIMGLDAMKYLCRVDCIEPLVAFITTGSWEHEDLSKREREERDNRLRAKSDRSLMNSGSSQTSNGGGHGPVNIAAMNRALNYSNDSAATAATDNTAKSVAWVNTKDAPAIAAKTVKEDNHIREAATFKALGKKLGKKEAEALVREKLLDLQKYDNLGSVSNTLGIEQIFDVVKAGVRNRSPTREKK
jgi:ABC-type multidrug transport system ATPase subunit